MNNRDVNGNPKSEATPKMYESKDFYKRAVENDRMNLDSALGDYKASIKSLKCEYKEYASAKRRADAKGNSKSIAKAEAAEKRYEAAAMDFERRKARVETYCEKVKALYSEWAEMLAMTSHKASEKKIRDMEKFSEDYLRKLAKIEKPLADIELPQKENDIFENLDPIEVPEEKPAVSEQAPAQANPASPSAAQMPGYMANPYSQPNPYADPYGYYPQPDPYAGGYIPRPAYAAMPEPEIQRQSVRVEPVSVDISDKVEKAVDFAMKKLSSTLEKRIESYIANLNIPAPTIPAPIYQAPSGGVSSQSGELAGKVAEEEGVIIEKLSALLMGLRNITEEYVKLNAAYHEMANKQKDISELQKQTNDMQRLTAREAQGVQVNQKVINTDQVAVAQEQALIYETQKTMTEKQKLLSESQTNMQESQQAVVDTQAALEEAMKVVMDTQRDIITKQQAIISGNNKNIEAQKEIIELQTETSNMQKEVGAVQRQILREQKSIGEKQKEAVDMQKEITECVRDVIKEQKSTVGAVKKAAGKQ